MSFDHVVERIGLGIDAAGVAIIVLGAIASGVVATRRALRAEPNAYQLLRRQLGQTILLGLELLVAGDIVRTVATSPTPTSIGVLGGIVLIRTFLSISLEVEINGRWPWRKGAAEGDTSKP
ncbi:MAG: DUF1622 domain-containing protein [Mycobacterium sp.]|nr:DUF1622 domain-containing protein [Mycobacterium sp.]